MIRALSHRPLPFHVVLGIVVLAIVGIIGIFLALSSGLERIAVHLVDGNVRHIHGRQTVDYAGAITAARTSLIQLGGGLAVLGGLFFTAHTYLLARTTQRAERFTSAIGQLGNRDSLGVRTGGMYGLQMIAQQAPTYWAFVDEVLASFVRQNGTNSDPPPADVEAALRVLGARKGRSRNSSWPVLDFRGAKLRGIRCIKLDLARALFDRADLDGARFSDAILTSAQFGEASMRKVHLGNSDCRNCNLRGADLGGSNFLSANLEGADMKDAIVLRAENLTRQQIQSLRVQP